MLASKKQFFIFKSGLIIWSLWLFINYLIHHPSFYYAITQPPYLQTIFTLLFISVGVTFYLYNKKNFILRGWKIYLFLLLLIIIIYQSFVSEIHLFTGSLLKHQFFFLINNLMLHMGTLIIFISCLAAGYSFIRLFKGILNIHHQYIISIAIGMALHTFLLMILAALGYLQTLVIIPFIILLLIWQRKTCWSFIKYVFWNPIATKDSSPWAYIIIMIILIFTAFNLVGAIKIFPLGFDGAILYQKLTKELIDSQMLVKGGQAYAWPLFTTLGPLLFKSMVFSIFLSHIMGILCLWAMYHLGRMFLDSFYTWIAIVIFYTLPALSFLHFVDEKVDLGFLFICASIIIFIIKYGKSIKFDFSIQNKTSKWFFIILGLLLGFAMGIKYLGLLLIIGIISIFIYQWGGIKAYLSTIFFTLALLFSAKVYSFGYLIISPIEKYAIIGISLLLGVFIIVYYFKIFNWEKGINVFKNLLILSLVTILSFMPWAIKNSIESGNLSSKSILYGKSTKKNFKQDYSFLSSNNIPFKILEKHKLQVLDYIGQDEATKSLDDKFFLETFNELKSKKTLPSNSSENKNTGKREEILRYLGYEPGLNRYLSLPYDITMGTNIPNKRGINISFLFLLFLPLLIFSFKKNSIINLKNGVGIFVFVLVLFISWNSITYSETSLNITEYLSKYNPISEKGLTSFSNSIYFPFLFLQNSISGLTQPIFNLFSKLTFPYILFSLISFCILLAWIAKDNWSKFTQPLKLIIVFIASYGFLWWILGNGITYYALIIWMLASLLIVYYYNNITLFISEELSPFVKKWSQIVFTVFLIFNLFIHFSNSANKWRDSNNTFLAPFIAHYSNNLITNENFKNSKIILTEAANVINKDITTKVYLVGTFMNYHINKSNSRVFKDNQLNSFDQASKKLQNPEDFLKILKLNGVKYIVFDLKVASIDQTPEKSLIDKATRFVKVLNNKEKIRLVMTDNKVTQYNPKTKKQKTVYGLVGKTSEVGSIAVFEIL